MSALLALALMSAVSTGAISTGNVRLDTVDLPVPGAPGQYVALHCVVPARASRQSVLFIHGASFPTRLAFGFEFSPGDSWLAYMAHRGFLACGLDFLGFGASSRPVSMAGPSADGAPVTSATEAAQQIARAVDYLRKRRGMATVHLVAHSWGTIPAAAFAATHPDALASLTLFGPVTPETGKLGAPPASQSWWSITAQERYQQLRFKDVLPADLSLLEPAVSKKWATEFKASVPHVPGDADGSLRIPAGPLVDIDAAHAGHYPYDPAQVTAPVFVVYGDYDIETDDARSAAFLARFIHSPLKWRLRIDHGTHVMHLEGNRHSLYESTCAFIQAAASTVHEASSPRPASGSH